MNAAEEMVVGAARQAAEMGDVTVLVASLLIVVDNQQATVAQVLAKPYLNARPHGQPDPWREGYNQALREVRDTLMDGSHE